MLPQPYPSSENTCSVLVDDASVVKLPPVDSNTHNTSDAVIAGSSGDATPETTQSSPARNPHGGKKLVSVGPRPLILGTVRIVTTSPTTTSSKSRPSSATSIIPRARWSSYTCPLTPISSFSDTSFSDEVASLKTRLAESEAIAEDLRREKLEASSAARRLFTDLQSLQYQKVQWTVEKEVLITKLKALDEDKATPVVPPPSEGVWFARSGKQQQVEEPPSQSTSGRLTVGLDVVKTQGTQRSEGEGVMKGRLGSLDEALPIPEIRVTPPEPLEADSEPEVDSTLLADACTQYLSPRSCHALHPRTRRRCCALANTTYNHSQCIPEMVQQTAPPNPPLSGSLRRHFLKWPRIPATPPLSASLRRHHLKWPRNPANPLPELGPPSTRWLSGAPQVDPPQPSLADLESQTVGIDQSAYRPSSDNLEDQGAQGLEGSLDEARLIPEIRITPPESSGTDFGSMADATPLANGPNQHLSPKSCLSLHRRTRHRSRKRDNSTPGRPRCIPVMQRTLSPKVPLEPLGNAFGIEDNCPPINLATEAELQEARMRTVSSETKQPRGTIRNERNPHIFPDPSSTSPGEIGRERQGLFSSLGRLGTPWRRSTSDRRFAAVEQHATLESPRKRGPFGTFTSSSSPRGTTPSEVAGDPQPKQKSRLRKLLNKGRCLISRVE